MVEKFSKMLLDDLYALKTGMESGHPFSRDHSGSTGSDSLSVHSFLSNPASGPDVLADAEQRAEQRKVAVAKTQGAAEAKRAGKPGARRAVKPEAR